MPRHGFTTRAFRLSLSLAFTLLCAHAAQAAKQTFVASGGDDASACDRPAPCRTFAGALMKTDNGGEVAVAVEEEADGGEAAERAVLDVERRRGLALARHGGAVEEDALRAGAARDGQAAQRDRGAGGRVELDGDVVVGRDAGVDADGARASVEGCLLTDNEAGIHANDLGEVRLSDTTVTDNEVGIKNVISNNQGTYGNVITFGNNRVNGNGQNVVGKPSVDALPY